MSAEYIERAVVFGSERGLVGILTMPSASCPVVGGTAALLVNAGVIHRVGPNRVNVTLARELASAGVPSLRFDQSGLGDSAPRRDTNDLEQSVARDVDEAMAYLADAHQMEQFVMVGICSGARLTLRTAYRSPRIRAAVVIDPPAYKTTRAVLSHFAPRLLNADTWRTVLSGRNQRVQGALERLFEKGDEGADGGSASRQSTMPERLPEWPTRDEMATALDRLIRRKTRMYWIYTHDVDSELYNYRDQLRDVFPEACASGLLQWELLADTGHDFPTESARAHVAALVRAWVSERLSSEPD